MRWLPNALSGSRLVAAPALIAVAVLGSRPAFLWLLAFSLATDALDGIAARALNAESDLGRKLDSWGDYVTVAAVLPGLWILWPGTIRNEGWWLALGAGSFFLPVLVGLLRTGKAPGYHTTASKVLAVAAAPTLFLMLLGITPIPFRVAMALQILVMLEEFAIMRALPGHSGSVPSYWSIRR